MNGYHKKPSTSRGLNFAFHPINLDSEYRPSADEVRRLRALRDVNKMRENNLNCVVDQLTIIKRSFERCTYHKYHNEDINQGSLAKSLLLTAPGGKHWQCSCLNPILLSSSATLRELIELQESKCQNSLITPTMQNKSANHLHLISKRCYENAYDLSFYLTIYQIIFDGLSPTATDYHTKSTMNVSSKLRSLILQQGPRLPVKLFENLVTKKKKSFDQIVGKLMICASRMFYGVQRYRYLTNMQYSLDTRCLWDLEEMVLLHSLYSVWPMPNLQNSKVIHPTTSLVVYIVSMDALLPQGCFTTNDDHDQIAAHVCQLVATHLWSQSLPDLVAFLPNRPAYRQVAWLMECVFDPFNEANNNDFGNLLTDMAIDKVNNSNGSRHILLMIDHSAHNSTQTQFAFKIISKLWNLFAFHQIEDVLFLPVMFLPELLSVKSKKPRFGRTRLGFVHPFTLTEFHEQKLHSFSSEPNKVTSLWSHLSHLFLRALQLQCTHFLAFILIYYPWQLDLATDADDGGDDQKKDEVELKLSALFTAADSVLQLFDAQLAFHIVGTSARRGEIVIKRALRLLNLSDEKLCLSDLSSLSGFGELFSLAQPIHYRLSLVAAIALCFVLLTGFRPRHSTFYINKCQFTSSTAVFPSNVLQNNFKGLFSVSSRDQQRVIRPLFLKLLSILSTSDTHHSPDAEHLAYSHRFISACQCNDDKVFDSALANWELLFPPEISGQREHSRPGCFSRPVLASGLSMEVNLSNAEHYRLLVSLSQMHCPQLEAYCLFTDYVLAMNEEESKALFADKESFVIQLHKHATLLANKGLTMFNGLTADCRWPRGFWELLFKEKIVEVGNDDQGFRVVNKGALNVLKKDLLTLFVC